MSYSSPPETEPPPRVPGVTPYLECHPWPSYLWRLEQDELVLIGYNVPAVEITADLLPQLRHGQQVLVYVT